MKKSPFLIWLIHDKQPIERGLLMVTLQENAVKFNNNLIVSHDGGRLSSDSGLVLIDELMDAFQFTQLSEDIVTFNDSRKY